MTAALALAAIVLFTATDSLKCMRDEAHVKLLRSAVRQFCMDCGRLPTQEEGLEALIHRPGDWPQDVEWMPYLETTNLPTDSWGHEFNYVVDANLIAGFGIYSCGLDGVTSSGGNDQNDINTWNTQRPWANYYTDRTRRRSLVWPIVAVVCVFLMLTAAVRLGRAEATKRGPAQ